MQINLTACPLWWKDARVSVFGHNYSLQKCQYETISTLMRMCHSINLRVYKTQHTPSIPELETWSNCRLKYSSSKLSVLLRISNVSDKQHQKKKIHRNHFSLAITTKKFRLPTTKHTSSAHTLVWPRLEPFLRVPLSTAPIVFSERASHLSHCTEHLTWYSVRPTNSLHLVTQCAPSPCPRPEIVCIAALCCSFSSCPSSVSLITEFSCRSNTNPFHCISCRNVWTNDFVSISARFSADVHTLQPWPLRDSPTAVDKERVLTNDVWFRHLPICICHVRMHFPARVLSGLPVPWTNETSRINIASLVADAVQRGTQLRHLSARVSVCLMQNTTDIHRLQFSNSIDFCCPWHFQPNHCPTKLAKMHHAVHGLFQNDEDSRWLGPCQISGQSFQSCPPWSFCRLLHLLRTNICLEMQVTTINWQILQAPNNSTVDSALLHVQRNIIVNFLFDGSNYAWRWCWCAVRQHHGLQHCSVGHNISPVVVQHSLTLEVFKFHSHFVHCPDFETDSLWEVGLDQVLRGSRSNAMEIIHVYPDENNQLHICRELWRCITSVETLLFNAFCHEIYPACPSASRATQMFSPSPRHRSPMRHVVFSSSFTWKYGLVTSVVNVRYDSLRLKNSLTRPVLGVELGANTTNIVSPTLNSLPTNRFLNPSILWSRSQRVVTRFFPRATCMFTVSYTPKLCKWIESCQLGLRRFRNFRVANKTVQQFSNVWRRWLGHALTHVWGPMV